MKTTTGKVIFSVLLISYFCLGAAINCAYSEKYHWKWSTGSITGGFQDVYAKKVRDILHKKSNGNIEIDVYQYGQLGTIDQVTELVMNGAVHFQAGSPGHLGSFIPEVQVFSIHYLMPSDDDLLRRLLKESLALNDILGKWMGKKNLKLMVLLQEGWQWWTTNRNIRQPKDFKDFKIRVMTSPLLVEAYRAYGANATPLPYGEVYGALQTGVIDGQVNPLEGVLDMKFYEQADYMIDARQLNYISTLYCNAEFFNGLPKSIQKMLTETIEEISDWAYELQFKQNKERYKKIVAAKPDLKIFELIPEEKAAFKQKAQIVKEKFIKEGGPQAPCILEVLEAEMKRLSK